MITLNLLILVILSAALVVCVVYFVKHLINLYKKRDVPDRLSLMRYENNPIIKPKPYSGWETVGTFNPAAIEDDEGFVHLFYRAIGDDGVSRIGHVKSKDSSGLKFEYRTTYPIFDSRPVSFAVSGDDGSFAPKYYEPTIYSSGGSWGGCEDPRAVVIDGRVYMTYTSFEGWQSVRIALTSISMEDLKAGKWNWKKPKYVSALGQTNKNWLIFPEKVNGKYAILHSIVPKVMIEYVDSLDNLSGDIKSPRLEGPQPGRSDSWDNIIRGGGPPPIKTKLGWLLLYHAIDKREWDRYKLGAMILDVKDPTKILYRSSYPILAPDAHYENDGKPGVVYASGALVLNDDLFVYYGGGDKTVCVAKTPLKPLLAWLKKYGKTNY
jgi:predicted GH43/DUF377 family glycosyl hydrolase